MTRPSWKIGPEDVDVGQVRAQRARQVGVVADDDVALVVAVEVAERLGHVEPEVRRGAQAPGIGHVLPAGRDQPGREVRRLLHERRVGGALHDPRHVLDDRLVVVAQDLERDPVDGHGCAALDHEVAEGVDRGAEAGRHQRGRVVLLDDRRAVQVLARPEVAAVVHGGVVALLPVVDRRGGPPASPAPCPAGTARSSGLGVVAGDRGAQVDQLDVGRAVGVGVEALVAIVERRPQAVGGRRPRARRARSAPRSGTPGPRSGGRRCRRARSPRPRAPPRRASAGRARTAPRTRRRAACPRSRTAGGGAS